MIPTLKYRQAVASSRRLISFRRCILLNDGSLYRNAQRLREQLLEEDGIVQAIHWVEEGKPECLYLPANEPACLMSISNATISDLPELLTLVNSAFRGDSARQGWTHESDLIQGTHRIDEPALREVLQRPGTTVLKYCNVSGAIEGCVMLDKKERGLYLGMLTVAPALQGAGIGKQLLAAADEYGRRHRCPSIYMTVFSVRPELIAWYERHGYRRTGETRPYQPDPRFGLPTQDLVFVVLEKDL